MHIDFERTWMRLSFTVARRQAFYKDLAAFAGAGIAPHRAVEKIRQVSKPRRSLRWLVKILTPVVRAGAHGAGIASALRPFIPGEEAAMLSAGEAGGNLVGALNELAVLLGKRLEINAAVKKNFIPSVVMLIALVGLMVFILKTVLGEARSLIPPEVFNTLQLSPYYFGMGEWMLEWLWLVALVAVAAAVALFVSMPRWKPVGLRAWLDRRVVPWTLYSRIQASFFLVTAASLMKAGQPFKGAVEDIRRFAAPWSGMHMRRMLSRLAAGQDEVQAMQSGMLPWEVEDRLLVYAMLPEFREVMQSTAADSMETLLQKVNSIGNMIRISIMAILGLFIVFTVFSLGEISLAVQSSIKQMQ